MSGVVDLVQQQFGLNRAAQQLQGPAEQVLGLGCGDPIEPVGAQVRLDEDRRHLPAVLDAVLLQPVAELVLAVRGLQRAERLGRAQLADGHVHELAQPGEVFAPVRRGREFAELAAYRGEAFPQCGGGAHGGGSRVVELVGEPGGRRSERQQPLPLTDRLLGVLEPEEQALQQVDGHREPAAHDLRERVRRQHEEPGPLGHPHRVVVHLGHLVAEVRLERPGIDAGR